LKGEITNPERLELARSLRKASKGGKVAIWSLLAEYLNRSKRRRVAVNLSRIDRYTADGDIVLVPGKTLGSGILTHPVTVAAFSFSNKARERVEKAGGKCVTIREMMAQNPEGSKIKIIG